MLNFNALNLTDTDDLEVSDSYSSVFGLLLPTIHRYVTKVIFVLLIIFSTATAHSKVTILSTSTITPEVTSLSDIELFEKAKLFSKKDQQKSIRLANEALNLSTRNNNHSVSAKVYGLLGDIAYESDNVEQSLSNFSQAILMYEKDNDKTNQIKYSIKSIDILVDEKDYELANKMGDEIFPIALDYGQPLFIAKILMAKGDSYYKQKRFNDAISQYIDSVNYIDADADDKTIKKSLAKVYKLIAQSYKRLNNKEKTSFYYKKTLDVYTKLRDEKQMARTLNTLAEAERHLGHLMIALEYSVRSLEIQKKIDDPTGRHKALMGAGIIYRQIGRYEKSLKHIYEAHLYYKKINDVKSLAKTSNQLGFIYTRLKQFEHARSFYELSIDLSGDQIDQKTLASAFREMAVIDLESGDYNSAMVLAKKSYKIYQMKNEKAKGSTVARIIGNIYSAQMDDKNAIIYYQESLDLATDADSKLLQVKTLTSLGGTLIDLDVEESIILLKRAVVLSTAINNKRHMLYVYRNLLSAEKLRGNFSVALDYAEKEIALSAIIQREDNDNELILTKANLYSKKMEMELESLRKKTAFDQLELMKKNNEIEISAKAAHITELELTKNKYASVALALLLAICVLMVVLIYRRFIASNKLNSELDYLVARDPLTNCYNRRALFDLINYDFENLELVEENCIIMVDIDHFKGVNDTYGHSAGDSVLLGVVNILQNCIRQNDIVARFGGDEFCIVLRQVSQRQAMLIAESMRTKIEKSEFEDISVTCSFGVTSILFNAKTSLGLINQADLALYKSKSLGRNQVTMWHQSFESTQ